MEDRPRDLGSSRGPVIRRVAARAQSRTCMTFSRLSTYINLDRYQHPLIADAGQRHKELDHRVQHQSAAARPRACVHTVELSSCWRQADLTMKRILLTLC